MSQRGEGRLRAWLQCLAALIWFFMARSMAHRGALALATEQWVPLAEELFLAFLLVVGYSGLVFWLNGQLQAVSEQGLTVREGWQKEFGLGLALGWTASVLTVLPMALLGGIAISLNLHLASWGLLLVDATFFALWALVEEVAFRGYGFQRFLDATGSWSAPVVYSVIYALIQAQLPGSSRSSFFVALIFNLALSLAYLRSRALWVSWGMNFAWKASRGLLFGLAVCGNSQHTPLVQGDPLGSFWLTGGGFGLDGSWTAFAIFLLLLPVLYKLTRDLDFRYNAPVFVPGGIAVDIDASARQMHQSAMGPEVPAAPQLIQILPAAPLEAAPQPKSREQ
jgi:hypothetical protein